MGSSEVFSGPPNIAFSWRHFGKMTDAYHGEGIVGLPYKTEPTNKMVEIFSVYKATVNDKLQIQDLQVFYDPDHLFVQFTAHCPFAPFANGPRTAPPAQPHPPAQSQPPPTYQPPQQFQSSVMPEDYYHRRHHSSGKDPSRRRH